MIGSDTKRKYQSAIRSRETFNANYFTNGMEFL